MTLYRSAIAKDELASKTRQLTVRERGALFLANGQRTRQDLQELLQDDGSILANSWNQVTWLPLKPGKPRSRPV